MIGGIQIRYKICHSERIKFHFEKFLNMNISFFFKYTETKMLKLPSFSNMVQIIISKIYFKYNLKKKTMNPNPFPELYLIHH